MDNKEISSTNLTFEFLYNSKEFLNIILNRISNAVLLLNRNMELFAFNDPVKSMFINKRDEDLLYVRCGEAIGCAYTVEEMSKCGETSHCAICELRAIALESYVKHEPVYRKKISREFYKKDGSKDLKHLQFSVLPFYFKSEYYIIVIVEEITELVNLGRLLHKN